MRFRVCAAGQETRRAGRRRVLVRFTGPGAALAAVLLAAVLGGAALVPAAGQEPPPEDVKPTPQQWQAALTAVREVALDPEETVEHRANAVLAYARLQLVRGQYDDAVKTCLEVLKAASAPELAEAAVRAGCFASRALRGQLGAPVELIDSWRAGAGGGHAQAAIGKVRLDFAKAAQYLMEQAGRKMPPDPIAAPIPGWAVIQPNAGAPVLNFPTPQAAAPPWMAIQPGRGPPPLQVALPGIPIPPFMVAGAPGGVPSALKLDLPVYAPADWYGRVQFPALTEPKK